jgi:uncharacterized protein
LCKEDIVVSLEGSAREKDEAFADLVKRRILVPKNNGTYHSNRTNVDYDSIPLKTLVLHLTEACNLGCVYCYHAQKEQTTKKKGWMTSEVAQKAIGFLFDQSGSLQHVTVVFFGGEPLLNFDLLTATVRYAKEEARKRNKEVDFALTTNGTLLTQEVIRFLHANRIGVTVSIDGHEEAHDQNRSYPDGSPSYKVIAPKIQDLIQQANARPVVARVTLAGDPEGVPQILNHLLALGFSEVGFGPVTTDDPSFQLDWGRMDLLLGQFKELAERFLSTALAGEFMGFSNLIDLLVSLHEGDIKHHSCGAGLGLFSVAPDGGLYLCQRFTGEEPFRMGDVFEGLHHQRVAFFRRQADIQQRGECRRCWVRNMCAGGCYHEAWIREGSYLDPNSHYCEWIKRWVEIGLDAYGRLALTCPDYLDRLSLLRGHSLSQ